MFEWVEKTLELVGNVLKRAENELLKVEKMSAIIEIMLERVEEKKINNQINIEPGSSAC